MFIPILITFFSLVTLAALHEFGHFVLAKRLGIKVEEFGLGYPPRLFSKKIGETIYSFNLLPFGAFVRIYGEDSQIEDLRSLSNKPIWQRALIILGGVLSFWVIGAILLTLVFSIGAPIAISDSESALNPKVQLANIAVNSPAQIAGLKIGDTIQELKIQNEKLKITKVEEVQKFINAHLGEEVVLTIERGKEIFDVELIPRITPPVEEGAMGVVLVRTAIKSYPLYLAPLKGIEVSAKLTFEIINGFWQIFSSLFGGKGLPKGVEVMGPVGIGSLMFQVFQIGSIYYLQFLAIIALHLAIINILPIPAVDGGKLLFLGIEKIKGSPINQKVEKTINTAFFTLLVILMIFITIKDIAQLF